MLQTTSVILKLNKLHDIRLQSQNIGHGAHIEYYEKIFDVFVIILTYKNYAIDWLYYCNPHNIGNTFDKPLPYKRCLTEYELVEAFYEFLTSIRKLEMSQESWLKCYGYSHYRFVQADSELKEKKYRRLFGDYPVKDMINELISKYLQENKKILDD
jgi:hypothetical protein